MSDPTDAMDETLTAESTPPDAYEALDDSENTVLRFDPAVGRSAVGLSWAGGGVVGSPRFKAGEVLGVGGMAVVHSADQVALDRRVALKALPTTRRDPSQVALLVREAQITAKLDHPHIVPVYDLDHDADGVPFLVMKEIVGESWRKVMHGDDDDRSRFERNMEVLDSVCDALRFAHSRGILHRDVKPANVMVGEYGEVYVVDWGIAVRATPGSHPLVFPVRSPWVGSPAYMAPEMIERGVSLSVRTDVYLLGGMLYEMLVGHPPHPQRGREALATSIRASPPSVPPGLDDDLVGILERSMAFAPEDRYGSVDEFQLALRQHLSHRVSQRFVAAANLDALEAAIARDDDAGAQDRYEELSGTLRLALDEWAQNPRALEMRAAATERFARFCLARGRPDRAQQLLRSMVDAPESLDAECAAALAKREAHVRVGQERDLHRGARWRVAMVAVAGAVAILIGVVQLARGAVPSFTELIVSDVIAFVMIALFSSRRELVREVRLHRNVAMLVSVQVLVRLAIIYAHDALGLSAAQVLAVTFLLWSMLSAGLAAMADWRMLVPAAIYAGGFFVALHWPAWVYPMMCAGHVAMLSGILFVFARPRPT